MAARTGLTQLILDVREKCELGTADYTVNAVTYWTDDQLQIELDRQRMTIYREQLHPEGEYTTGTVEYYDYYWRKGNVEEYDSSNTEIFHLEDAGGTAVGTADYAINYEARHIRFSANQAGSAYYLTYRHYDIDRVASKVWKKKASHVAQRFDLSSDNHNIKASQLVKQYLRQAEVYARSSGPKVVQMVRGDLN